MDEMDEIQEIQETEVISDEELKELSIVEMEPEEDRPVPKMGIAIAGAGVALAGAAIYKSGKWLWKKAKPKIRRAAERIAEKLNDVDTISEPEADKPFDDTDSEDDFMSVSDPDDEPESED